MKAQTTKRGLRCAIYTRVSTDQGLEQDFNSLDAQREASEAYIKSQAHEGWRLVRDRYDDGGFSGGSMDRPALQKLLLRQEKSWKGGGLCNLKPFEAIQRVRPPPGRGAARQPEASLAWAAATALVKRRQRMLKPCVSLDIMYPLRPSVWVGRGRRRQGRQRRGLAGSAGVLEQGKGMGRIARKPERSRSRPRAQQAGSRNTG